MGAYSIKKDDYLTSSESFFFRFNLRNNTAKRAATATIPTQEVVIIPNVVNLDFSYDTFAVTVYTVSLLPYLHVAVYTSRFGLFSVSSSS